MLDKKKKSKALEKMRWKNRQTRSRGNAARREVITKSPIAEWW